MDRREKITQDSLFVTSSLYSCLWLPLKADSHGLISTEFSEDVIVSRLSRHIPCIKSGGGGVKMCQISQCESAFRMIYMLSVALSTLMD